MGAVQKWTAPFFFILMADYEDEDMGEGKLMFDLPLGAEVPTNVTEGQTFEATATFKLYPGDKVCLVEFDGFSLDEDADAEEEVPEPEVGGDLGFVDSIQKGLSA